jgi:hypothetical protein
VPRAGCRRAAGRILAVSISLNMAGPPLGPAIGGLIVTRSPSAAFTVAAVASLAAYVLIPRLDEG